jgi:hypothetical protein
LLLDSALIRDCQPMTLTLHPASYCIPLFMW